MNFFGNGKIRATTLVILAAVLFFGVVKTQAQNTKSTNLKFDPKKDRLVKPEYKDIKENLTLAGSIDTSFKTDVRFQTSGILSWVGVKVGDRVKKGQALASLDRTQLRKQLQKNFNDYQTTLSAFQDTQDKYQPQKDNYTLNDEMKRILDRSQHTLDNSVIDYELSDLAVRYATILSPIDGVVTAVDQPVAGVNITPASATFTVMSPNDIYFKTNVNQDDIGRLQLGDKAKITLDSFPDKTIDSDLTFIAFTPVAGESSTVYETRFKLPVDNSQLQYRLGMDGNAYVTLAQAVNVLSIPTDAVQEEDSGQKFVYIKTDNNQLVEKNIKVGIENDNDTQITDGLSPNDQVVIKQR